MGSKFTTNSDSLEIRSKERAKYLFKNRRMDGISRVIFFFLRVWGYLGRVRGNSEKWSVSKLELAFSKPF